MLSYSTSKFTVLLSFIVVVSAISKLTSETITITENETKAESEVFFKFTFHNWPVFVNRTSAGCTNHHPIQYIFNNNTPFYYDPLETVRSGLTSSVILERKNVAGETVGVCNGNLLTPEWVLTTAICLETISRPFTSIKVHAGVSRSAHFSYINGSQILNSEQFFTNNDIGLIKLNGSFKLSNTVNTVNIALQPWNFTNYQMCSLSGFKLKSFSKQLEGRKKTILLNVTKTCSCSHRLENDFGWGKSNPWFYSEPVSYSICPEYLGSGILCKGKLLGMAAMDITVRDLKKCSLNVNYLCTIGREHGLTINVFQSTCHYLRWINSHLNLFNDSETPIYCDDFETQLRIRPLPDLILGFFALNAFLCSFMLICGRWLFKLYNGSQ